MSIADNFAAIRARIAAACARSGRDPQQVRLIAVSKTKPAADIAAAQAVGQRLFGESYVQEFVGKYDELPHDLTWHFIGGLQSNKVKYLAGKVAMIHSIDRLSLAEEIDRQWAKLDGKVDVLLQVNVGDESSKSGVAPDELEALVRAVATLPHLQIRGLMALPPFADDPEEVRPWFKQLHQLAEQLTALQIPGVTMDELSMGMSNDFEVAIEEGATLVRVGTALFGERHYA